MPGEGAGEEEEAVVREFPEQECHPLTPPPAGKEPRLLQGVLEGAGPPERGVGWMTA